MAIEVQDLIGSDYWEHNPKRIKITVMGITTGDYLRL
ncbi:MAG: hypothetical protein XD76_0117 [candidate division TA06 bacterium 32_111]|uniref:Uncharacterized protein n=1 Tax=candidate division TA06 bacterium 34_109 TaxID=1635277 RepID=A0A101I314_UNCT6|nr:MAG: hypothetical protein XD76_0117 [candidate division TA06 bacterium 32_111]KUK88067.1 MAG: hypothetical protein XE03_0073 [candidate division TA06 bacterium 34_109]